MLRFEAFDVRPDEMGCFTLCEERLDVEVRQHADQLTVDTLDSCRGAAGVSVLGVSKVDAEVAAGLAERGVRFVATRSIGYDNVDMEACAKLGIRVSHAEYPPESVAEYTVMLLLMSLRKMKLVLHRAEIQDYSLEGSVGRQLSELTVGILGAGRIGAGVARRLKPFGCRILAHDMYPNDALRDTVEYVDFDTLIASSDVLTLHAPALPENHHIIDAPQFEAMRDDVTIINCGRGDLIHTAALISAIESGKVGGAALDVLENDLKYFHRDNRLNVLRNHNLALLRSFPNVIVTPHIAFYTDHVVGEMVGCAIAALNDFNTVGRTRLEVTA